MQPMALRKAIKVSSYSPGHQRTPRTSTPAKTHLDVELPNGSKIRSSYVGSFQESGAMILPQILGIVVYGHRRTGPPIDRSCHIVSAVRIAEPLTGRGMYHIATWILRGLKYMASSWLEHRVLAFRIHLPTSPGDWCCTACTLRTPRV